MHNITTLNNIINILKHLYMKGIPVLENIRPTFGGGYYLFLTLTFWSSYLIIH